MNLNAADNFATVLKYNCHCQFTETSENSTRANFLRNCSPGKVFKCFYNLRIYFHRWHPFPIGVLIILVLCATVIIGRLSGNWLMLEGPYCNKLFHKTPNCIEFGGFSAVHVLLIMCLLYHNGHVYFTECLSKGTHTHDRIYMLDTCYSCWLLESSERNILLTQTLVQRALYSVIMVWFPRTCIQLDFSNFLSVQPNTE